MSSDDVRVERSYVTDEGEKRAALLVEETVVATLDVEECFDLVDDLVSAGERLVEDDRPSCPKCGDPVTHSTVEAPEVARLSCGCTVPPNHELITDDNTHE